MRADSFLETEPKPNAITFLDEGIPKEETPYVPFSTHRELGFVQRMKEKKELLAKKGEFLKTGEPMLFAAPKEPLRPLAENLLPFLGQIEGTKEWQSPDTAMEIASLYAMAKILPPGLRDIGNVLRTKLPISQKVLGAVKPKLGIEPSRFLMPREVPGPEVPVKPVEQPLPLTETQKMQAPVVTAQGDTVGVKPSVEVQPEVPPVQTVTEPSGVVPVTKPTLESIEPSVKGGATGELPKYAGGKEVSAINLDRIEGPQDLKQFINQTATNLEGKIGKHKDTVDGIIAEAEKWGYTPKDSLNMAKGLENFSNQIANIRVMHRNLAEETFNTIKGLPVDEGARTPELLASVKAKLDQYSNIAVGYSKVASQWGKAGAVLRKDLGFQPEWGYQGLLDRASKLVQDPKNYKKLNDIISRLQEIKPENIEDISRILIGMQKTKWEKLDDAAYELWINGLLSNPKTHIVNTTSNLLTLLGQYPERALGAGIEKARSSLGILGGKQQERFMGETIQDAFAAGKGIQDGMRRFLSAMKTGKSTGTKLETGVTHVSALPPGLQKYMPTRALTAEDEFFKGFIENAELNRIAYRMAKQAKLSGDVFKAKVGELLSNPTEEMLEQAGQRAKYLTYQKDLGKVGKWIMRGRDIVPGLKYFIPFVKTPANIAKFGLERTPLNIGRIAWKVGKGELQGGEFSEEAAKVLSGSMLGAGTYLLASQGYVTGGGPKNTAEKDEKYRTGWLPYSVKVGDTYYSFARLEPVASIVGLAADMYELREQLTEGQKISLAAAISGSIAKNYTSKTFIQGFSQLNDAISDPGRFGEKFIKNLTGSVVPTISAGITRSVDPEMREAKTIIDTVRSRIPGISEGLPSKLSIWGEPVERAGTSATRFLSPMEISGKKGTPIDDELVRLKLNLGMPSKHIGKLELTDEEYRKYVIEAGQKSKKASNSLIQRFDYQHMNDADKGAKIHNEVNKIRKQTRDKIIREMPYQRRKLIQGPATTIIGGTP